MSQVLVDMEVSLVEIDLVSTEVLVSTAGQEVAPSSATPIELTVEPEVVQVGLEETTVRVEMSSGPRGRDGLPGASAVVLAQHIFATTADRDAYFVAHPEELTEGVMVAITGTPNGDDLGLYTHAASHTILAEEMNATHLTTSPGLTLTLPPATSDTIGRWCRVKNNSGGPLTILCSGSDTLAGNSQMDNSGATLYDLLDAVVEAAGVYGVHHTRGIWEGDA